MNQAEFESKYANMNIRADNVRVAYPLFQTGSGGSTPTSALQLHIQEIRRDMAVALNKKWHSRLPNYRMGCRPRQHAWVCYGAFFAEVCYAVAIWSHPNSKALDDGKTLELRRLAIAPDAPKNTASRMLRIMKVLTKKNDGWCELLISYQDTEAHTGIIYKAAGWTAATVSEAMDYTYGGKRSRPTQEHMARKVRWQCTLK